MANTTFLLTHLMLPVGRAMLGFFMLQLMCKFDKVPHASLFRLTFDILCNVLFSLKWQHYLYILRHQ